MTLSHDGEKSWRDFVNEAVIQSNIAAVYKRFERLGRLPAADERNAAREHLQRLANISIAVHFDDPQDLLGVMQKGHFASLMELDRAETEYAFSRRQTETALFGDGNESRPDIIYGILADEKAVFDVSSATYGNVTVVLRPETKRRATVTRNDSLNALSLFGFDAVGAFTVGIPVIEMDWAFSPFTSCAAILASKTMPELARSIGSRYIEAQIHGGVTTEEIERVEVRESSGTIIGEELKQWLFRKNIPLIKR